MLLNILLKSLLPRTLFARTLMIIVTPLVILQLVSAWIFYDRHWDTITRRLAYSITGDIGATIELWEASPDEAAQDAVLALAMRRFGLDVAFAPDGILAPPANGGNRQIDRFMEEALAGLQRPFRIDSTKYKERVIVQIQLATAVMTAVIPGKRLFSSTTYIFMLWMVGTSLVLFAVASLFMRNQVRPIRRLAAAADEFGKGRDLSDEDFPPEGATEVRQAAAAFNQMRQRIRRHIRQRTDMLSGVSHDLRTPLTRMKLQLAMLPEGPDLTDLTADIDEMERMIDGYLTFARGEGNEAGQTVDLGVLVSDLVAAWRRRGARIDLHVEGRLEAWLRPDAIKRSIENLIANARRYGTQIWVRAGNRGDAIEVTVDDDGPGIPEESREDVFRPFFRLDESRNLDTGGTGLGLAIARDLVRGHGGDISLEDSPHGGLRARIRLPV